MISATVKGIILEVNWFNFKIILSQVTASSDSAVFGLLTILCHSLMKYIEARLSFGFFKAFDRVVREHDLLLSYGIAIDLFIGLWTGSR